MSHECPVRVVLGQIKTRKGDIEANVVRIRQALTTDADVTVFPEAALTGYFVEGAAPELAFTRSSLVRTLGPPPPDCGSDVILGFYERDDYGVYNSVAYLSPGTGSVHGYEILALHRKVCLATFGLFQEARFVQPGRDVRAFDTRFGRLGMLVCEDMVHSLSATALALDGARTIFCACASPARNFRAGSDLPDNLVEWDRIAARSAHEHGVFVFLSQMVGSEGGRLFAGGSTAWGPSGALLARAPLFQEESLMVEMYPGDVARVRGTQPRIADLRTALPDLRRSLDHACGHEVVAPAVARPDGSGFTADGYESKRKAPVGGDEASGCSSPVSGDALAIRPELVEAALLEFIRDEVVRRRGFSNVVLGISGGVDSAVALHLSVRALGPDHVFAFRLPHATSSPESLTDAARVAEATGVRMRTIDITDAVEVYVGSHEPDASPLRRGNVAARVRSTILFDQAAKLSALPLGTGNKSERLFGYYTWHADDSPPINPIGDLFKTQVLAMARHLGIPDEIIDKPPSADLVRGVDDEDELGISYQRADPILHWITQGHGPGSLVRSGFCAGDVDIVWQRVSSTHWKRQLPTVALLSDSGIGAWYLRPVDF